MLVPWKFAQPKKMKKVPNHDHWKRAFTFQRNLFRQRAIPQAELLSSHILVKSPILLEKARSKFRSQMKSRRSLALKLCKTRNSRPMTNSWQWNFSRKWWRLTLEIKTRASSWPSQMMSLLKYLILKRSLLLPVIQGTSITVPRMVWSVLMAL